MSGKLIAGAVDTAIHNIALDAVTLALSVIDYEHHEIHNGDHFFVRSFQDVADAATNVDWLLVVPDSAKLPHVKWEMAGEAEFELRLYEGAAVSAAGSALTALNNNRNSAEEAGLAIYSGPTITALGTLIYSGVLGSTNKEGGDHGFPFELVLKRNTRYVLRLTHIPAGTHWLNTLVSWYEHTSAT